ncbi:uncharacterized protein CANTADRAFT_7606 [Suhomyces tanzawaensis NRRL Y-17324]|uniref:Dynamin-type G domain-containing protein n=1 Tax=Suhomyces tanzawaensis NRRL Y-17324 TaxID=984487 RepID=A0A1E4SF63_9ASCO|nr:uncharacterized protein CANTADRAFT_7606 [Suhomyces tanzawaensis NRRL Y-17324]ODV78154.1 hypothetical protein CANTADRAFT_7606 [Suhomyces tanzawaensis NRRL Y-17324]
MSEGFIHLKRQVSNSSDDATTLIQDDEKLEKEVPSSVMYIPEEGRFGDHSTLVDGQTGTGSSSKALSSTGLSKRTQNMAASLQQLQYNEYKISLDRAINQTIELLYELTEENQKRPVFYPTKTGTNNDLLLNSKSAHIAMIMNEKSSKALEKAKTAMEEEDEELPTFKILKLDLKSGHNEDNLMQNLDKKSISSLLTKKLSQQVKYLLNLKDRVDDTTSKVFVTGDLNSGKSTFCNALLRRKLLPEDQQPCTSVFCEVIDASKENNSIEEVHAVRIGSEYNQRDESTYEKFPLDKLEDLVYDFDSYQLLKVYVLDNRTFQESLLHNGVIDIKLIDAPGLNLDSYQTTQVFSRQEEIDLVVFVVNSENHFTLSAKEFIAATAAEKRYVFIVVNKFDNIKNKERCMQRILDQVKTLSPDTYKNAKEFIHFVSSTDVLGDDGPDGDDDPDNNDGPERSNPDFDHLEASLRKFILEKRAISKLLPAKSYLLNILNDLESLSRLNEKVYTKAKEQKVHELKNQISPKYNEIMSKSIKIGDTINNLIDHTYTEVYNNTKKEILTTVNQLGESSLGVQFNGIQNLYEFARDTQQLMFNRILETIITCEEDARSITSEKVDEIIKYGQSNLGEEFLHDKVFNSELMFTRKRDSIKKKLDDSIEFSDFFDPSLESFLLWIGVPSTFVSTTRDQINYYNPVGLITSIPSNAMALKQLVPSQLTLHTLYSSGKILTTGALAKKAWELSHVLTPTVIKKIAMPLVVCVSGVTIYYLLNDIPHAFPRNQAKKIKKQIHELDYPHNNATRIARECQRVLNYPSRQVMNNFQTSIDKRSLEKEKLEKAIKDAEISSSYFSGLLGKAVYQKGLVEEIDLESMNQVD